MNSKKIFCCYPSLDAKPELKSLHSLWATIVQSKHNITLSYQMYESLVSRMRDTAFMLFLRSDCEYFMTLDSDIEIMNPPKGYNYIDKLVEDDKDWVGGIYSLKKPMQFLPASLFWDTKKDVYFNSGLHKMRYLSSGSWFIKRHVIEAMYKQYKDELEVDCEETQAGNKMVCLCNPFIVTLKKEDTGRKEDFRKLLSEDWAACVRWQNMGGEIYADTSILLNHIGKFDHMVFQPNKPPPPQQQPKEDYVLPLLTPEDLAKVGLTPKEGLQGLKIKESK